MKIRHAGSLVVTTVAISTLLSSGCVGKKLFRTTIDDQDQRIEGVRTAVEENEQRVGDLKKETSGEISRLDGKTTEALQIGTAANNRAERAERLATGTVLWETTLSTDGVLFRRNSFELQPAGTSALEEVARQVKAAGHQVYVEVQGHTDSTGDDAYNMALGQKRAEEVRRFLHEKEGIPLHLIEAISYGETMPVADNGTREGREANRRVVVRVLDPVASIMRADTGSTGSAAPGL